jgi:hypothetical protein
MITLNTILYEGNFDEFLVEDCWFFTFKSKFITKKLLTINNLTSTDRFNGKIEVLRKLYHFDIIFVEDSVEEVKEFFEINIDNGSIGYYYTIPYFVAIFNIKTDYILNIASDCMHDIKVSDKFLEDSLKELVDNPLCSTTMVSWVKDNMVLGNGKTVGQHEYDCLVKDFNDIGEMENFIYMSGFTDQFFLGKISKLREVNYNLDLKYSDTYHGPSYGGNCFEKRMVGHQTYNKVFNCSHKNNDYYIHDKI